MMLYKNDTKFCVTVHHRVRQLKVQAMEYSKYHRYIHLENYPNGGAECLYSAMYLKQAYKGQMENEDLGDMRFELMNDIIYILVYCLLAIVEIRQKVAKWHIIHVSILSQHCYYPQFEMKQTFVLSYV